MQVVMVVVIVVGGFVVAGPWLRTSHDEAIVVDNGPVRISRRGVTAMQEGTSRSRWEMHQSQRFRYLHVWSWPKGSTTPHTLTPPLPLRGVSEIIFDLVLPPGEQPRQSVIIRRDPWWRPWWFNPKARVASAEVAFEWIDPVLDKPGMLKPQGREGERFRLADIRLDERATVCLRDGPTPVAAPCRLWKHVPERVVAKICMTAEKCEAPEPPR